MKKLFFSLVSLFIIYFMLQWAFIQFNKGHTINYEIVNDAKNFKVDEILKANQERDRDNYYLKINASDVEFTYQIFDDFDKKSKIIENIFYYEDANQKCIIPIFLDNRILFDVTCYDGDLFNYYHNISNPTEGLKTFVSNLDSYGYNIKNWNSNNKEIEKEGTITIYNNMIKNHYIGLSTYKGISLINKEDTIRNLIIFGKDIYQRPISGFVSNYYITADYNGINDFDKFKVVSLKDREAFEIITPNKISFNSYFLGSVGNSIYLYDKDSRLEYDINVKEKTVRIIGEKDKIIKYYADGIWNDMKVENFNEGQVFGPIYENKYENDEYIHIVKRGHNVGYYYLFKKVNDRYQVYRINIQNRSNLTYLFTTTDYNKIVFLDDYIYYLNNNSLNYYNNKTGSKLVLINTEFEFNKSLIFNIYEQK